MKKVLVGAICCLQFVLPLNIDAANDKHKNTIVHNTVPIVSLSTQQTNVSYNELKSIFTLSTQRWDDGTKITVVLLKNDNSAQRAFLWEYFGLSQARYREVIAEKISRGANPPIYVLSEFEMVSRIARTPGSIGFAGSAIYDQNVRVVSVK